MKKLILHIGCYKTGSTSIQHFLYKNSEKLLEQGVNYLFSQNGCNHIGQQYQHRILEADEFSSSISSAPGDVHILSDESLWNRRLKRKGKILDIIAGSGLYDEVIVVGYVRRQDALVESFFKQEYKTGMTYIQGMTLHDFYRHLEKGGALRVSDVLKPFESRFGSGNIKLGVFEKEFLKKADVVVDFCEKVGIAYDALSPVDRQNESASSSYCTINFLLRTLVLQCFGNDALTKDVTKKISLYSRRASDYMDTSIPLMSDDFRRQILDAYRSDNAEVSRKYNLPEGSSFALSQYIPANSLTNSIEDLFLNIKQMA